MVTRLVRRAGELAVGVLLIGVFAIVVTRGTIVGATPVIGAGQPRDRAAYVAPQVFTPIPTLSLADRVRYATMRHPANALPILAYHDIGFDGDPILTVRPGRFAEQMAMLRAAGFHPVTTAQLAAWLIDGEDLPRGAILLTFDDGPRGVYRYADPILAALGWHAVDFAITGNVGRHFPYYSSWEELRRMHRTSRWDIEDHTRNGHNRVRVDAAGDRQPFLLNRQWIVERPEIGRTARSETVREFASRIRRDLSGSARDVAAEALPRPTLFAYPFSAVVEPTNDPRLPAITREAVDAIFPMSVVTTWPPRWVVRFPGVQAHLMPRFSIDSKTVPDDLFLDLSGTAPLSPNVLNRPLTQPGRWVGIGSNAAPVTALMANDAVTPPAGRGWRALLYAPAATLHWRDYVAKMRMRAIVPGAAASLLVRGTLQSRVEVAVSQGSVVVTHSGRSGSTLVVRRRIPRRAGHDVAVRVRGDRLSVTVDGHKVVVERIAVMEPNGGVGFATWVGRVSAPRPRVSVLSIAPIDDRQRVQQVGAVLGMALGADRDDLAPPVRRSAV